MSRPGDLLLHPAAVGAVLVLVVNDHYLKGAHGSTVTGKLSDVAGVFFLPLLLLTLVEGLLLVARRPEWASGAGRTAWAVAVTGLGFAAVKVVPVVGDGYEVAVGLLRGAGPPIVVVRDASDLLVLPVLLTTWLVVARVRRFTVCGSPSAGDLQPRGEQQPHQHAAAEDRPPGVNQLSSEDGDGGCRADPGPQHEPQHPRPPHVHGVGENPAARRHDSDDEQPECAGQRECQHPARRCAPQPGVHQHRAGQTGQRHLHRDRRGPSPHHARHS